MCLLCVLRLADILARRGRQVVRAETALDVIANAGDGFARHLHPIRPHVCDQPGGLTVDIDALIEALGQPHRLLRPETKLPRRLLLQRRGCERRRRVTLDPLTLDRADGECPGFHRRFGRERPGLVVQVELIEPLAVQMCQPSGERCASRGQEQRLDGPIFTRPKYLDFGLAVADQAQRHGLHTAGAAAAGQLPPQHRRQGEPHQIVQRAPSHVCLDQRLIEFARMVDRVANGVAGDFVEADAVDRDALQCVLVRQHRSHVPGNRLTLTIRVGGEPQRLGALKGLCDRANLLVASRVRLPVHREILLRPDAAIFRRQIAHMSETGENGIAAAQIAIDRFGLGGGFDDDDI